MVLRLLTECWDGWTGRCLTVAPVCVLLCHTVTICTTAPPCLSVTWLQRGGGTLAGRAARPKLTRLCWVQSARPAGRRPHQHCALSTALPHNQLSPGLSTISLDDMMDNTFGYWYSDPFSKIHLLIDVLHLCVNRKSLASINNQDPIAGFESLNFLL